MTGVQELEKVESLAGTDFPEQNSVRPVPQSRFQKVPDGDCRRAILFAPRFEAHKVRMSKLDFRGVLDQKNALISGNKFAKSCEQSCLPCVGSLAAEDPEAFLQAELVFLAVFVAKLSPIAHDVTHKEVHRTLSAFFESG